MKTSAAPMTIRLDADTRARMRRVSKTTRLSQSSLVRLGLMQTLTEIESGRLNLPTSAAA